MPSRTNTSRQAIRVETFGPPSKQRKRLVIKPRKDGHRRNALALGRRRYWRTARRRSRGAAERIFRALGSAWASRGRVRRRQANRRGSAQRCSCRCSRRGAEVCIAVARRRCRLEEAHKRRDRAADQVSAHRRIVAPNSRARIGVDATISPEVFGVRTPRREDRQPPLPVPLRT